MTKSNFLQSSTGQIRNFMGYFFCIKLYFGQSAKSKLINFFMIAGQWVLQILMQNAKFYWVKLGPIGYLFMKKTKFKTRIYMIISTPYHSRLTHVGVEGVCFLADCLSCTQNWPVDSNFLLVDLTLDIYLTFLVSAFNPWLAGYESIILYQNGR